jgi:outer membrane protein TolC
MIRMRLTWILLCVATAIWCGCSTAHYRKSADKEAARIIAQKTPAVPNMDLRFTIDTEQGASLDGLPLNRTVDEAMGADKDVERDAPVIALDQSLNMAVSHARDYQNQKELVYLSALNLSSARHNYTPLFSGGLSTRGQNQPQDVQRAIDQVAGTQTSLVQRDTQVVQQYNVSGSGNVAGQVLLRSGTRLLTSFNIDFLRFLTGDARWAVRSSLGATITQPLLRGAGYKVAMENLTQAERSMLYSLRGFTQFRKDFTVRIAQQYYGLLRSRDEVRNNFQSYQSFKRNVDRQRALADEGRIPLSALGQIEQQMLNAESAWIGSIRGYRQALDQFKIALGLPTGTKLMLDDRDLTDLKIVHPALSAEDAVEVAVNTRLDLATSRDRKEDAERQVGIAANGLKAQLDLVGSGNLDNKPNSVNPFEPDLERPRGSIGATMTLPLDRLNERNRYRTALIQQEQARRQYELDKDSTKLQVYDSWRNLDQAKRNYEINELAVKLAERRVEEQELLADLGKIRGLDLVDAQLALVNSRNDRTRALVTHVIARLQFWNAMGILYIDDGGKWKEVADAKPKPN